MSDPSITVSTYEEHGTFYSYIDHGPGGRELLGWGESEGEALLHAKSRIPEVEFTKEQRRVVVAELPRIWTKDLGGDY
jgi:hypothetical protein